MPRTPISDSEQMSASAQPLPNLDAKRIGAVPRLFRCLARRPSAFEYIPGLLGFLGALAKSVPTQVPGQRFARAVAEVSRWDDWVTARTPAPRHRLKRNDARIPLIRSGASSVINADSTVRVAVIHTAESVIRMPRSPSAVLTSDAIFSEILSLNRRRPSSSIPRLSFRKLSYSTSTNARDTTHRTSLRACDSIFAL